MSEFSKPDSADESVGEYNEGGAGPASDWTEETNQQLRVLVKRHGHQWAIICKKLGTKFTGPQCGA